MGQRQQFRNIRQEQMRKRRCLLVGGKCPLATPLFVFTGGSTIISSWFWAIVGKVENRIVILKPTASFSTSAPPPRAKLIVGKKLHVALRLCRLNPTQMLVSFLPLLVPSPPAPPPIFPPLLFPSSLISDFSHISAWAESASALQSVCVRLLLRQHDRRLGSRPGWMSQWVPLSRPSSWPSESAPSSVDVFAHVRGKKKKKRRYYQAVSAHGPYCPWRLHLQSCRAENVSS